jgi:ABC-type uncharacterized transport system permease subunit
VTPLLFFAVFAVYFATLAFCFTRFESRKHPARYFIFFSLPAAILVFTLAVIYLHPSDGAGAASGGWLWLHLGLILGGLAGLLTAVSSAMMYLLQSAQLKSHRPGEAFFRMPSLDSLDRMHFTSLVWGTLLFSLGILSGILWARDMQTLGVVFGEKKVVFSLATCLMYWGILAMRFSPMRRGQKIAVGTVFVFVMLFAAIVSAHDMSRWPAGSAGASASNSPTRPLAAGRV